MSISRYISCSLVLFFTSLLGGGVVGCGAETPTQVFVCYSVEEAILDRTSEVRVCVTDADTGNTIYGCDANLLSGDPISQGVLMGTSTRVRFTLSAMVGSAMVTQSAIMSFEPEQVLDLNLQIQDSCVVSGGSCSSDETCVDGGCQPLERTRCTRAHGGPPSDPSCDSRYSTACMTL